MSLCVCVCVCVCLCVCASKRDDVFSIYTCGTKLTTCSVNLALVTKHKLVIFAFLELENNQTL